MWRDGAFPSDGCSLWKIENETFNTLKTKGYTLKTKGYNLEHNFGHGKEHLSALLANSPL